MKGFIFGILPLLVMSSISAQGVLVGTQGQAPDSSAAFEVRSQTGGFLVPRLTTTERNAIQSPTIGLQVYNTETDCIDIYFPTGWRGVSCLC